MKKYIKPEIWEEVIQCQPILAGSVQGVSNTLSFDEELSDGSVDSYMSREDYSSSGIFY